MNPAIWKFPLEHSAERDEHGNMVVRVTMPKKSHVLTAREQGDMICVWAGCNPDPAAETQEKVFLIVPTGNVVDGWVAKYVGTAFIGQLVFHVFESMAQTSV